MEELNQNYSEKAREIIYCGIGNHESVLHFGACDKDLHFIKTLDQLQLDIEYTAVDSNEDINDLLKDYEPLERTHPWFIVNESMQEFIDNITEERYNWTVITGVFDKPLYSERQYQFIDTVIRTCLQFSDGVIFTINENPVYLENGNPTEPYFQYSILYLFSQIVGIYPKSITKKIGEGQYIFCITTY